jgi:hypothetical protein
MYFLTYTVSPRETKRQYQQIAREKGKHELRPDLQEASSEPECLPFTGIPFSISYSLFLGKHFLMFWWRGVLIWIFLFYIIDITKHTPTANFSSGMTTGVCRQLH